MMRADLSDRLVQLRKLGIGTLSLNIPWVMPDVGFNNISAGTSLSALTTLAPRRWSCPARPRPAWLGRWRILPSARHPL